MFGFLFGTLCLFGLAGLVRHNHCRGDHGSCGGGYRSRWHSRDWEEGTDPRRSWVGGEDRFARAAGEVFKRRLRIHEEQEAIIDHALHDLRAALKELRSTALDSRSELADAFRGETVDDARLAVLVDRYTDALKRARQDVVSALKQVHAVLDPEQRVRAADWLGKGPRNQAGWV